MNILGSAPCCHKTCRDRTLLVLWYHNPSHMSLGVYPHGGMGMIRRVTMAELRQVVAEHDVEPQVPVMPAEIRELGFKEQS